MESPYIHKRHNVSALMYHVVCAAKYRRVVMSEEVDAVVAKVCLEIGERWEVRFLEIGLDRDHARFLLQSAPMYSPTKIVLWGRRILGKGVLHQYRGAAWQRKSHLYGAILRMLTQPTYCTPQAVGNYTRRD